jgi:hypothetical protein
MPLVTSSRYVLTSRGSLFTREWCHCMSIFGCKSCPQTLQLAQILHVQLQDSLESRQKAERAWTDERKELLDRIQSLSRPEALREFRREALSQPVVPGQKGQVRMNWPGFTPPTRPPLDPERLRAIRKSNDGAKEQAEETLKALDRAVAMDNS